MIEVAHIVARVTTDLTRFNTGMAAAEARAKTTTERMSVTGQRMTKYLSLPLAAIGYSAVKQSIHFSDAMAQIRTQTGASAKEVESYRKAIMKLAPSTTQGPEELAKGLYHLRSVGLRGKEALDALKYSAEASQMGFADLEDTTSVLAGTMRVLKLPASQLKDTMAAMHAAVGTGNMRLEDLNRALGTGVLATAHLAHLGLRDVTASMAVFTDENQNAASSMTRMRTALMMMLHPSSKAAGNMAALGFNAQQLGVKIQTGAHGWEDTIKFIAKRREQFIKMAQKGQGFDGDKIIKVPKMSLKEARTAAFANLAGAFGGSKTASQIMLLINNSDMLMKKWKQNRQVEKHWDEQLEASNKQMGTQLRKAWSSIRVGLIELGNAMTPTIVGFAKGIAAIARAFAALPGPVKKFIGGLTFILILLGPMLIIGSSMVKMWTAYKEAMITARIAQLYLNDAIIATGRAMLTNPLFLFIALAVVIGVLLWKSKTFRRVVIEVFKAVWDFIKLAVGSILSFVKEYWPYILGAMLGPFGLVAAGIYRHWGTIKKVFFAGVHAVIGFVKSYWPYLIGAFLGPLGIIAALVYRHWRQIWHFIKSMGPKIFHAAVDVWWDVLHWMGSLGDRLVTRMKNGFLRIIGWIKRLAGAAYTAAKHLGSQIKNGMMDGLKGLGKSILRELDPISHVPGGKKAEHFLGDKVSSIFKAAGGPVTRGNPYIVGERGPEWFIPNSSGRILPHGQGLGGHQSSPTVTVQNMNVRAEDDIYAVASIIGRRLSM